MFILTHQTSGTFKAQIRTSPATGCKQTVTASSTESEASAARAALAKAYPPQVAQTLREVRNPTEISELCGNFFRDPKRKQVFTVWAFNPNEQRNGAADSGPPQQ